jgi:hypothetical protein
MIRLISNFRPMHRNYPIHICLQKHCIHQKQPIEARLDSLQWRHGPGVNGVRECIMYELIDQRKYLTKNIHKFKSSICRLNDFNNRLHNLNNISSDDINLLKTPTVSIGDILETGDLLQTQINNIMKCLDHYEYLQTEHGDEYGEYINLLVHDKFWK